MANMTDYIDWRGDLTFEAAPFCEVDNLVFAELVYTEFETIPGLPEDSSDLTVSRLSELFWAVHTPEEILAKKTTTKMAAFLLKKAAESARFGNVRIRWMETATLSEMESQFAAATFILPDGSCYAAFRGTDDTLVGWKEDFNMFFLYQTPGQVMSADYLNRHFEDFERELRIGGHSKGGNFAMYAAMACSEEIRQKIRVIYANDAPGFRSEIVASPEYHAILDRIVSFVPEDSIAGMLLEGSLENTVLKSTNSGAWAHDAMSWEVLGASFVRGEGRSDTSHRVENTMRAWISGLNDQERREFVDDLFEALESAGATKLSELRQAGNMRMIADAMQYIRSLPEERQENFKMVVKALALSSVSVNTPLGRLSEQLSSAEQKIRELKN